MRKVVVSSWVLITSAAAASPLTLAQAIERAASNAPEVRLAARALDEAEAGRVGAGVPLPTNPRVFVDYRRLASAPVQEPINGFNLGVDGTLEVSGAGFSRVEEAERRVALARSEFVTTQSIAKLRAWNAFVEMQAARERVLMLEEALATAARVEAASRERQKNGVVGEPDVVAASLELSSVRLELHDAERLRHQAHAQLRQVLDLDPDAPLELVGALAEPGEVGSEAELVARALETRPELAIVRARLSLLEMTDTRLAREALPRLSYNLGFDAAPASQIGRAHV